MKQKIQERLSSIELREKGYSVNEIVQILKVAKGSVSLWVRNVSLDDSARQRLLTKVKLGQLNAGESKRKKTQAAIDKHFQVALRELEERGSAFDAIGEKTICALLYWCEGAKNHYQGINFVNSDANVIATFLCLLRKNFVIDEAKFRPCIHLHGYHDPAKQLDFWQKATGIPAHQFTRPYLKPNTGRRIRKEYQGCIAIRYHSNDLARQLLSVARAFFAYTQNMGV